MNNDSNLKKQPGSKKTCKNRSIIRASGIYDVVVMSIFAIPVISAFVMTKIQALHTALTLSGALPDFLPFLSI